MKNLFVLNGGLNSGKTQTIQQLLQDFSSDSLSNLRISGYIQKGVCDKQTNQKIGYDLIVLPNVKKQYNLARLLSNQVKDFPSKKERLLRHPRTRYSFNNDTFQIARQLLKKRIGETDLWFFDEIGKLELFEDGHHQIITEILKREKNLPSSYLITSRKDFIEKICKSFDFPKNVSYLDLTAQSSSIVDFKNSILNKINHR
ncbi:cancer-related nucleoside-triphosphatase [Anaeramoeba flamelloides]|uniref:Cancer-related nucleoside-triphosphatase n=1 Tax=Anaeramoeba flamelloides TaxID=1746091 RepID=A0ABQ8X574_9EUKA|nr:cancer-related nucleoside-triphosphatase [Anaeramoeba flamelloides]